MPLISTLVGFRRSAEAAKFLFTSSDQAANIIRKNKRSGDCILRNRVSLLYFEIMQILISKLRWAPETYSELLGAFTAPPPPRSRNRAPADNYGLITSDVSCFVHFGFAKKPKAFDIELCGGKAEPA